MGGRLFNHSFSTWRFPLLSYGYDCLWRLTSFSAVLMCLLAAYYYINNAKLAILFSFPNGAASIAILINDSCARFGHGEGVWLKRRRDIPNVKPGSRFGHEKGFCKKHNVFIINYM